MKEETSTPRTDAERECISAVKPWDAAFDDMSTFARKLERELVESRLESQKLRDIMQDCLDCTKHVFSWEKTNNQPKPMTTDELIDNVKAWGVAKGITGEKGKGSLLGQLEKTQEELTETRDAAAIWTYLRYHKKPAEAINMIPHLEDGLGDCMVTLILAAEMAGMDIRDCLAAAYEEIRHRTGKMEGGKFIKD